MPEQTREAPCRDLIPPPSTTSSSSFHPKLTTRSRPLHSDVLTASQLITSRLPLNSISQSFYDDSDSVLSAAFGTSSNLPTAPPLHASACCALPLPVNSQIPPLENTFLRQKSLRDRNTSPKPVAILPPHNSSSRYQSDLADRRSSRSFLGITNNVRSLARRVSNSARSHFQSTKTDAAVLDNSYSDPFISPKSSHTTEFPLPSSVNCTTSSITPSCQILGSPEYTTSNLTTIDTSSVLRPATNDLLNFQADRTNTSRSSISTRPVTLPSILPLLSNQLPPHCIPCSDSTFAPTNPTAVNPTRHRFSTCGLSRSLIGSASLSPTSAASLSSSACLPILPPVTSSRRASVIPCYSSSVRRPHPSNPSLPTPSITAATTTTTAAATIPNSGSTLDHLQSSNVAYSVTTLNTPKPVDSPPSPTISCGTLLMPTWTSNSPFNSHPWPFSRWRSRVSCRLASSSTLCGLPSSSQPCLEPVSPPSSPNYVTPLEFPDNLTQTSTNISNIEVDYGKKLPPAPPTSPVILPSDSPPQLPKKSTSNTLHASISSTVSSTVSSNLSSTFSKESSEYSLESSDATPSKSSEVDLSSDIYHEEVSPASAAPDAVDKRLDPALWFPSEICLQIFGQLDCLSLTRCEQVSHAWRDLASSGMVWRSSFLLRYASKVEAQPPPRLMGGLGLGPDIKSIKEYKRMFRARKQIERNWLRRRPKAIYFTGHTDSVYCCQFDEEKLITGSRDRTIRVWSMKTFKCIKVIGGPGARPVANNAIMRLPTHRNATVLNYPSMNGTPEGDAIFYMPQHYHRASILCLYYDDEYMLTGSSDHTCLVWDIKTFEPIRRLVYHTAGVLDVCMNSQFMISSSKDATICVWSRETGQLQRILYGHKGPVNAVQLRGDLLVSASGDGMAKLWNLKEMRCIRDFASRDRGLAALEFSDDARFVLAGGNDQVIYKFDATTGRLLHTYRGHKGLVRCLYLDSLNSRVISGSYDQAMRVYAFASSYDDTTAESSESLNSTSHESSSDSTAVVDFSNNNNSTGEKQIAVYGDWTTSWILAAKADYRRIVATSQDGRAVLLDFGWNVPDAELLLS